MPTDHAPDEWFIPFKSEGKIEERLVYDFDLGVALARSNDVFDHDRVGCIAVDILLARFDRKMTTDPFNYERRENGLLLVDEDILATKTRSLPCASSLK